MLAAPHHVAIRHNIAALDALHSHHRRRVQPHLGRRRRPLSQRFFDWLELARPNWPQIWQCLGMVIGVYGVGYLIAAADPLRHWPIILVGLLGKVLGPIGFVNYALRGDLPWAMAWLILANDLIWWWPLGVILRRAPRMPGR